MRQYQPSQARPGSIPNMRDHIRRAAAAMLIACAALLGAGTAAAETLISNLGQSTSGSTAANLGNFDLSQAFTTGSTADAYELTGVKLEFKTVPSSTATVTAFISDGRGTSDSIIANLTNPSMWTTTSTLTVPSGITLDASSTYYIVIEGSEGVLASTSSNGQDSGGVTGWSIDDNRYTRPIATSGLGGTWASVTNALKISVEGDHKGTVTACSAASMEHQVWTGTVTAGEINAFSNGYGLATGHGALDDTTFEFGGTTYTINGINVSVAPAQLAFSLEVANTLGNAGNNLILHIGGQTYRLEDASYSSGTNAYAWYTNVPTWNEYDRICLALTEESPPGPPVLTAAAKTESIELTWTIADHGTADITRFDYRIKETSGGTYPATWTDTGVAASNSGGTFTLTGLTDGTEYTVQVRGVNGDGEGEPSNEVMATPDAPPVVSSIAITSNPGSDKTYAIGDDVEITVTFDKDLSLGGTDTSKPPGYITFQTDYAADTSGVDNPEANCTIGTNTKTIVCTQPIPEGWYDTDGIAVLANALEDFGQLSHFSGPLGQRANTDHPAVAVNPNHKIDGVKPTLSSADATSDLAKIVLTFSEDIGTVDRTKITLMSGTNTLTTTADSINGTKVEITLTTALTPSDTMVTVALAADAVTDGPGNGIAALAATSVNVEAVPSAPTSLTATAAPDTTPQLAFDLSWTAAGDGGSAITKHQYRYKTGTAAFGTWTDIATSAAGETNATSYTVTGRTATSPPTTFTFEVRAVNTNGDGAESNQATETVDVPDFPTVTTTAGNGQVLVEWNTVANNGSAILRHQIQRARTPAGGVLSFGPWVNIPNSAPGEVNANSLTVLGLTNGDSYVFSIRVVNSVGTGLSNDSEAAIPGTTPTAPRSLTADAGDAQVHLSWTAPSSDGGNTITGYQYQHKAGTNAFSDWMDIDGSDDTTTEHTITGLANGVNYTFKMRAVNPMGEGTPATTTATPIGAEWQLTLTRAGTNVTSLTEGGLSATVTVRITNSVRFTSAQTITIQWGGHDLGTSLVLQGLLNETTITIDPGQASGTLAISAPQQTADGYSAPQTAALTALLGDVEIGESIDLTIIDQSPRPELTITEYPRQVSEGDTITIELELDRPSTNPTLVPVTITDTDTALSGTVPTQVIFGAFATDAMLTLTTVENTVQNDGASTITFALGTATDGSYSLASPSSIQITVVDDDTAPAKPQNLRGAPSDGTVTLTWDLPRPSSVITGYEIQRDAGTWTDISGSNANTTTHTVTGLTNDTAYTFGIRAENGIGRGQAATVTVTPRNKGVFIAQTTISEGETTLIDIVPEGTPFDSYKQIVVVLASKSGPDQPRKTTDFVLNDLLSSATAAAIASRPVPGFPGTHPTYGVIFSDVTTTGELRLYAEDDAVSECREELYVYAYVDGQRIATSPNVVDNIFIEDDDQRPTLESATVNGRTVTLTFDQSLKLITEPGDPDDPGYQPIPPRNYFSLFTGTYAPGANSAGTLASTFSLSGGTVGRTVTLTFPNVVDEGTNAWVRYDRFGNWAPLGVPHGRPCAQGVSKDTWLLDNGQGGTHNLPALTIADAQGHEGPNANVEFTVTLSAASTELVTVDYRTIALTTDGAATAGEDFEPTTGRLEFTPGQTGKTVRVPIIDDTVEDDGETFLLDLYNASGATMVDTESWATGTIRNTEDEEPTTPTNTLTASFANIPAEHGGRGESNRFTFDLSFSENVKAGFRKIRDHAFTITGGDVKKAQRKVRGSNQSWTITVEPNGWGNISLTLPGGRACTASGGICTYDNRQLANSPSATISGPAALSVADASAHENNDDALDFVVSLDRSSTLTVTVNYATSNGTATAGSDYTATSGTLTFDPGDTAKIVSVQVLDDAIDDGGETMTFTLSNASNARVADGTATGTIENSDPLQQAWIARFGRTVASDVVSGITDRLASPRSGSHVQIGGISLKQNGSTWTETPVNDEAEIGTTVEDARTMTAQELLMQSAFRLQSETEGPTGTTWTAWGRFSRSSFEGTTDGVELSGDVTTGLLGADVGTDDWTAGIALSAAKGDGPFKLTSDKPSNRKAGTVDSSLKSVHPYAQVHVTDRLALWAIAGYGTGEMTIAEHNATPVRAPIVTPIKTDIDMTMAAIGTRGTVLDTADGDALDLVLKSDALWLTTTSDATPDMAGAEATVTRLRLIADASRGFAIGMDATLTPSVEAGIRQDTGDAEQGTGFELGAGVSYKSAGVSIEGKVRTLIAHNDDAYEEWGASAAIRVDPGSDGRGISLTITPTWGSTASEAEQLWGAGDAGKLVGAEAFEAKTHLDTEIGYGLGAPHQWGVVTPYAGVTLSDGGQRTLRGGVQWNASHSATFALDAKRQEAGEDAAPTNALMLRAQVRF